MLFLVWASTLFKTRSFAPEIIEELRKPMFMMETYKQDNGSFAFNMSATNEQVRDFFQYTQYPPLWYIEDPDAVYNVELDQDSPLYFNPKNCKKERSFTIPHVSSTIIGVIGKKSEALLVTNNTVNYL